jgi:hypothetical protein
MGWHWYLVTLVPVIGLIQAGAQARADRFTYIPMIGISIALVWGVSEALAAWPRIRLALAAAVCSACLVLTWLQVGYWRDSISLYQHAIDVTSDNYVARFNLASVLEARGDSAEAVARPPNSPGRFACSRRMPMPTMISGSPWRKEISCRRPCASSARVCD